MKFKLFVSALMVLTLTLGCDDDDNGGGDDDGVTMNDCQPTNFSNIIDNGMILQGEAVAYSCEEDAFFVSGQNFAGTSDGTIFFARFDLVGQLENLVTYPSLGLANGSTQMLEAGNDRFLLYGGNRNQDPEAFVLLVDAQGGILNQRTFSTGRFTVLYDGVRLSSGGFAFTGIGTIADHPNEATGLYVLILSADLSVVYEEVFADRPYHQGNLICQGTAGNIFVQGGRLSSSEQASYLFKFTGSGDLINEADILIPFPIDMTTHGSGDILLLGGNNDVSDIPILALDRITLTPLGWLGGLNNPAPNAQIISGPRIHYSEQQDEIVLVATYATLSPDETVNGYLSILDRNGQELTSKTLTSGDYEAIMNYTEVESGFVFVTSNIGNQPITNDPQGKLQLMKTDRNGEL